MAWFIAGAGIYALVASFVEERTREFGIRLALGASPGAVHRLVLRGTALALATGGVTGFLSYLGASQMIAPLLYGVSPVDAITLVAVCLLATGSALAASWVPARRASHIDPILSLRAE